MDKLACGIATSSISFSKRIIDFLEFIQPAPPLFQHFLIDIAGIRDRHQSESLIGITGIIDRHQSESAIGIIGICDRHRPDYALSPLKKRGSFRGYAVRNRIR
jgi:hypothetical protein